MSNATFSKNLFDILGDDNEVRQPAAAPVKEQKKVDEPKANGEKRANGKANGAPRGGARGGRRGGRQQNGRRGREFDRHSGTGLVDNEKKENQGWGHPEKAEAEAAQDSVSPKDPAGAEEQVAEAAEPEEVTKTLEEYLAEKANKSLKVSLPEARKANEGTETDAKWENAVAFVKEEEPDFYVNKDAKPVKKTEKQQRKDKVVLEIEQRFQEKPRGGFRGGERRGGNDRRGGERRGRGNGRRGRQSAAPAVNIQDDAAFPSLGATA